MITHDPQSDPSAMRLYTRENRRLYINASERARFLAATQNAAPHIRAFCLTLIYSGCRLSEARELTMAGVQAHEGVLAIHSLKKRHKHVVREVPVPQLVIEELSKLDDPELWQVDRATAYRWVKQVMRDARIEGPQATPKGLRHGYGIHAVNSGIQLNMLQKWMGHASIKTTAIYANAVGEEERALARRMWENEL